MADAKSINSGGPPDLEELLARAEALVPVLRERAAQAEELRRLPDETIEDLHRAGLFRILQPKRVGGSELPFRSIVELVSVIGKGRRLDRLGAGQSRGASLAARRCCRNRRRTRCGASRRTI